MLPPLPRRSVWAYCFAHFTQPCQPSPKGSSGRPAHRPFRGLLGVHSRCGLHTRERLQPLRCLHDCSGCFRLERLPGGTCTHWKAPPCHGAHPIRIFQPTPMRAYVKSEMHGCYCARMISASSRVCVHKRIWPARSTKRPEAPGIPLTRVSK